MTDHQVVNTQLAGDDLHSIPAGSIMPSEQVLRECFIQASNNARAFMDLRFKHFGTFVVLTGLLGTATFQFRERSAIALSLAGISVVLTALFWLLDFRTSQHFSDELHRIRVFKQLLSIPSTNCPKRFTILRGSHATTLIFMAMSVMWSILFLNFLAL